jgi:hypothetical protein
MRSFSLADVVQRGQYDPQRRVDGANAYFLKRLGNRRPILATRSPGVDDSELRKGQFRVQNVIATAGAHQTGGQYNGSILLAVLESR